MGVRFAKTRVVRVRNRGLFVFPSHKWAGNIETAKGKTMPRSGMKRFTVAFILCLAFSSSLVDAAERVTIKDMGVQKNMKAEFTLPDGNGPFPAVIVLHTSGGASGAESDYSERLAKIGYASLIPHYFEAHGISHSNRESALTGHAEEILADLSAALEWLKKNPRIDKDKIGAVGFSMGGYWAMVLAAQGKVQAGVSYYGVLSGVGGNREKMRYKFREIFNEKSSPVLILHGSYDTTQKVDGANRLSDILDEKKVPYEKKIYPYAGHEFERFRGYKPDAAQDSWERTVHFLEKYLLRNDHP